MITPAEQPHPDTQIPFAGATSRVKAPKTPSPGQFRAVADLLAASARDVSDAPLLTEAAQDVAEWCRYQAALKSVRK